MSDLHATLGDTVAGIARTQRSSECVEQVRASIRERIGNLPDAALQASGGCLKTEGNQASF